jgi:hypothetical protein
MFCRIKLRLAMVAGPKSRVPFGNVGFSIRAAKLAAKFKVPSLSDSQRFGTWNRITFSIIAKNFKHSICNPGNPVYFCNPLKESNYGSNQT